MSLKVIFKARGEGSGVDLGKWLRNKKNLDKIQGMRLLYVMRAIQDDDVFKLGIAGVKDGQPYGRLHQYVITYGDIKEGACRGVLMYYLGGTKYQPDVTDVNSQVFRRELFMKQRLKEMGVVTRGTERVKTSLKELYKLISQRNKMTEKEVQQQLRLSERNLSKQDKVLEITAHKTYNKPKKTYYRARWSRPDMDGNPFTDEPYVKLIRFNGGKSAVDKYEKLAAKTTARGSTTADFFH